MQESVLIENIFVLFVTGYAFHKTKKAVLATSFFAIVFYILFNIALLSHLSPEVNNTDHSMYYWLTSLLFTGLFGVFMARQTRLSVIMGGCVLAQAILAFFMALNGAVLGSYILPEFNIVYLIHESFNSAIWIIECLVIYVATTTDKK